MFIYLVGDVTGKKTAVVRPSTRTPASSPISWQKPLVPSIPSHNSAFCAPRPWNVSSPTIDVIVEGTCDTLLLGDNNGHDAFNQRKQSGMAIKVGSSPFTIQVSRLHSEGSKANEESPSRSDSESLSSGSPEVNNLSFIKIRWEDPSCRPVEPPPPT